MKGVALRRHNHRDLLQMGWHGPRRGLGHRARVGGRGEVGRRLQRGKESRRDPRKQKVAYIVSMFPCWSETFILREMVELQRRGIEVTVVSLKPCSESMVHPEAAAMVEQGHVVYAAPVRSTVRFAGHMLVHPRRVLRLFREFGRNFRGSWPSLAKSFGSMVLAADVIGVMRERGIRHVHAPWATYPSTAAWCCSSLGGFTFSFTARAHDLFLEDHAISVKLREARFAQTITEYNSKLIERRYLKQAPGKLHVIHSSLDPAEFDVRRQPANPALLLSVGRMVEMKGFSDLVDACALLRARGLEFRCTIVGEGPLRDALQDRIAELGLGSQVQLQSPLPQAEIRRLLGQAACFVLPCVTAGNGDQDGIPNVLMEAMAARVPVVSCATSGVPELVQHEVTGLLAETRDPASLARAIERLLGDPVLAKRLVRAGRSRVDAQFDIATNAGRLASLFPCNVSSVVG
jgi:glycosyltransferase involved in cell wall biosynthesis